MVSINIIQDYNVIDFAEQNADENEIIPQEWGEYYYPDYLPEGYQLASVKEMGNEKKITFLNGQNAVYFSQKLTDNPVPMMVDEYEDSGTFENGDLTAAWYKTDDGFLHVCWRNTTTTFYLRVSDSLEEAEKIVRNIAYIKK